MESGESRERAMRQVALCVMLRAMNFILYARESH